MYDHDRYVIDLQLRHDREAPAIARSFAEEHSDDLPTHLMCDAELLVSELVTNAVLHGRPQITLHIDLDPPVMGVSVSDGGNGFQRPSTLPPPSQPHGRGLLIVEAIARQHGITMMAESPGTTVWFELSADDYE